jgi:integrase
VDRGIGLREPIRPNCARGLVIGFPQCVQLGGTLFADVKVDVPKRSRSRETKAFRSEEVLMILKAALEYEAPRTARERARRWVVWLCAYSGARAGEVTQLRGIDIEQRADFHVMRLTPCAHRSMATRVSG